MNILPCGYNYGYISLDKIPPLFKLLNHIKVLQFTAVFGTDYADTPDMADYIRRLLALARYISKEWNVCG